MRNLTRRGFSTGMLAVLVAACGGKVEDEQTSTGTPETRPPTPGGGAPPIATEPGTPSDPGLSFTPVNRNTPPPAVVWSWTTPEQIAELRAGGELFSRESSPTLGRGYLFELLQTRADAGDAAAKRLVGTELLKGRFGWHNPWATVLGANDNETYGSELLAIRMKPDTLYARVVTSQSEITFVDAAGKEISTDAALAAYSRVGGILFDNDENSLRECGTGGGYPGTGQSGGGLFYREIYLGNEAQIASFSHRTQEIADVLDQAISDLQQLRIWIASSGSVAFPKTLHDWMCRALDLWTRGGPSSSLDRYLASLAFTTGKYLPTMDNLDALVAELTKSRFTIDAFTVTY